MLKHNRNSLANLLKFRVAAESMHELAKHDVSGPNDCVRRLHVRSVRSCAPLRRSEIERRAGVRAERNGRRLEQWSSDLKTNE